jgi:hypothetical protein
MSNELQIREGRPIQIGNFKIQQRGLIATGKPTYDEWYQVGEHLRYLEGSLMWAIGDWLNYGEQKYGEMYAQALDETEYSRQTLRNAKWVAGQLSISNRQFNVSWQFYQMVASQPDNIRNELLSQAELEGWTQDELRKAIKQNKRRRLLAGLPEAQSGIGFELDSISVCDIADIELPDNSIDMIFTDPPYHDEYLDCYNKLATLAHQVLKPGGMMMTYCGKMFLPQIHIILGEQLEYIWEFSVFQPFSKSKINKHHIFENWRPILCYRKFGETDTREWVQDVVRGRREKEFHEWQQDEDAPRQYIAAYTLPGQVVLDPFVGGGTTPKVCKEINRHYICFDIDSDAVKLSINRVSE